MGSYGRSSVTGNPEVESQLSLTGVGVDKVDIHKNGVILRIENAQATRGNHL